MNMTKILPILETEKDEIESLFERMNSLHGLSLTLAASNDLFQENSNMFERIVSDLAQTQKKYKQWWECIADKYNLDKSRLEEYRVNFQDSCLYFQTGDVDLENSQ
ncbi:CXXX repeat peptide modification system protein [Syntrophomonas curvata]